MGPKTAPQKLAKLKPGEKPHLQSPLTEALYRMKGSSPLFVGGFRDGPLQRE